jgi:hypothetical protein
MTNSFQSDDLEELNRKYQSILSCDEEKILHKPILALKIKPKDKMGFFKKNKRYLMFTNRKLYTMDPKTFEEGKIDREKLIVNEIDIQFLSHLIFFPDFVFDTYEFLDIKKLS